MIMDDEKKATVNVGKPVLGGSGTLDVPDTGISYHNSMRRFEC